MTRHLDPAVKALGEPSTLLAPELMSRVKRLHLRTHRLVNTALAGGYRSTFRGGGIEFEDVRPYQPGDEVRRIDWNVTARSGGEAFVKSFREERELTVVLVCDTSRSMDFGSGEWTKREAAAQLCALLSFVALRHQDRVGLELFGSEPGLHLPPRKGNKHVLRVIREVIAAPPSDSARSDLASVLEGQVHALKRRSMVFLVSDFLSAFDPAGAAEEKTEFGQGPRWVDALRQLNSRHDVISVRVTDPFEERLPKAGLVRLREIGTGAEVEVDTRSKKVRDAWEARATERRRLFTEAMRRARVDSIEISSSGDLAQPLARFFHRREMRYGGRH